MALLAARNPLLRTLIKSTSNVAVSSQVTCQTQDFLIKSSSRQFSASAIMPMKPLQYYTAGTPNGWATSATLEELKRVNPELTWETTSINIGKNTQKEPWFLKINPNGRIPALVDPNNGDFAVFETSAIMLYLEKKYDPDHHLSWPSSDPKADNFRSEVLQWMFFAHGGIGPMQGQANHFRMQADSKNHIPYALNRYLEETKRLYSVLESRLEGRDFLVGDGRGKYTLADIKVASWTVAHGLSGIPRKDLGPNLIRWLDLVKAKEGFQAGLKTPEESDRVKKILEEPDWASPLPSL